MTARRCRPGTSCRSSSNRSALTSDELKDSPVTLPPGCISVSTRPRETGSSTPIRTIRDRRVRARGGERRRCSGGDQDCRTGTDQFFDDGGQRLGALFGPAVEDTNVAAVGPAERRETVAKRNEKSVILLSRPRLDKADARGLDFGRDLVPGHHHHAGEQQKIAAFHWFNSRARFPSGTRPLPQMLAPWSRRAADGEAQLRSCRGPPGSAWSGRAVSRRARTAASQGRGAKPRRPRLALSDVWSRSP